MKKTEINSELISAMRHIHDGFIILDADFRYIYANERIGEMTGKKVNELIGQCVWDVFPEAVGTATYKAMNEAMEKQEVVVMVDYFEPFNLWQENRIYPAPQRLSMFVRDISDIKRAEMELQKLNRELEERVEQRTRQLASLNVELESFTYSVSHDLRAPLRAISGFAKMLADQHEKSLDENGLRMLNVVQHNAKKMGQLIDDLLSFSRLSRKAPHFAMTDMQALFAEVSNGLLLGMERKPEIMIGRLPVCYVDRALMLQAIQNLMSNAIKYTKNNQQARIEVNCEERDSEFIFCVADNGVGFDERYAHKLFEVFQRLHADVEFEGTGVGLAIVQKVITRHEGRVWAKSKVGAGAQFYFSLPS